MSLDPLISFISPTFTIPKVSLGVDATSKPQDLALTLQIMIFMTVLSLAPALLVLTTSFTRIVIVFSFVRTALGTQQVPPTQVLSGLALLLTFFIMKPTIDHINTSAIQPYMHQEISQSVAFERAQDPLRTFMLKQTREKDLALFYSLSKSARPTSPKDVQLYILIPAFVISELKTAFQIGFVIYIPFIVIDMVVASILLSMGMMMIPPATISLPFKILVFLLVDGWNLTVNTLFMSFT